MSLRKESNSIDWLLFSLYLSLVAVGWGMVYSVGYGDGYPEGISSFLTDTAAGKQLIWIFISIIAVFFVSLVEWKTWQTLAYLIYGGSMVLLVAVLFVGITIKGATSWIDLGLIRFQPSEIAKFATCLALASFLSNFSTNLKEPRSLIIALGLIGLPMGLILLQPDAGSALIYLSFIILLYREGLNSTFILSSGIIATLLILGLVFDFYFLMIGMLILSIFILIYNLKFQKSYYFAGLFALIIINIVAFYYEYFIPALELDVIAFGIMAYLLYKSRKQQLVVFLSAFILFGGAIAFVSGFAFDNLKPHQQDRINVWLQPSLCDPQGSLYNVIQSKIAIGSGGWSGKGFLEGTMTKLNFVPEQTTDFIFCTIGEEQGFIGSFAIIGLYLLLLLRIISLAEKQRFNFARLYGYGIAGILFVHFFINVGMTMGIMPIIGIPLPLLSKGGTSLLIFSIMIAVLLKFDSTRYNT